MKQVFNPAVLQFLVIFLVNFLVKSDHQFRCGNTNACFVDTEICVNGGCVTTCVDDFDCPIGLLCNIKKQV
jgi:hypothetical protein